MDHSALLDTISTPAATALISAFVSLLTLLVGSRATAAKRLDDEKAAAAEREQQIQKLALEQWQAASASIREDLDRYRLEVDRLRADNDRLTKMSDQLTGRIMNLEGDLRDERAARQRAEQMVSELRSRLGGAA